MEVEEGAGIGTLKKGVHRVQSFDAEMTIIMYQLSRPGYCSSFNLERSSRFRDRKNLLEMLLESVYLHYVGVIFLVYNLETLSEFRNPLKYFSIAFQPCFSRGKTAPT